MLKVRTSGTRGQETLAVTQEDYNFIKMLREEQGFTYLDAMPQVKISDGGLFYIILLVPELSEERIKAGFSASMNTRLQAHKTTCPGLSVLKTWGCKREWESAALACVESHSERRVGTEVFDCPDMQGLINKLDLFFSLL